MNALTYDLQMDAMALFLELTEEMPEQWRCREPSDILGGLLCGRRRHDEGDHAELAKGHPHAVTIWPSVASGLNP